MARVLKLFIVCVLLYAHCEFLDEFEPMGFDDSFVTDGFLDDQDDGMSIMSDFDVASPLIKSIDQMVEEGSVKPKKSKVQNFYAKKKIGPGSSEMVMGSDLDETQEISFDSEAPTKKEKSKKSKKSKTSKAWKKFKKLFRKKKSKSKKESRLAKAVKIAKAEQKSKEKAEKAIKQKPKQVIYEAEPKEYEIEEIPIIKRYSQPRPIGISYFKSPAKRIGYPMEVEIQLRKENSNPTKGFVRTVKYIDGQPIVREKRINSMTMDIVPPSMPIIFDPYTSLIETTDGQKKLLESLDQMFAMKGFGSSSNSNPSSISTKDAKKKFIPCDMRRTCEECTVDFSCYYCSSKKQCFPAKYFGTDSFTGSHCPASDIYYFETCKVKSFVFMFFLIIIVLCLLFAVVVMGFSLIYRRTRRAKIYNVIKEKEDEIDSNGKHHPLIE